MTRLRSLLRSVRSPIRFYNRLMLYNTLIFLAVAYLFAFVATRYSLQLDTVKQLQQSRDALNAVFNYYETKHDHFLNLVFSFYDTAEAYETLSDLLETGSDDAYENDPFAKQRLVRLMEGLAVRDSDIAAILIYKNATGARYVYTRQKRLVDRVTGPFPFFDSLKGKTTGRYMFGTRTINSGALSQQVYGISGTVGTKSIRQQAGQFMVAFQTQALARIYKSYAGKAQGRFAIVSDEGEVVFDSDSASGAGDGGLFPQMDILKSGVESAVIDGKIYYVQTVTNPYRKYMGVNLVPKQDISQSAAGTRIFIFGLFTIMALVCAILYSVAGKFVSRRVNELIKGMKRVSSNNWSYRIPLTGRHDEFEEIAARFNQMCNELQQTINREYVSEIKKKNAELHALQAGINPHFLYNTLEAIRVKAADDGNAELSEMIVLLANLYRSIVRDHTFIPIRKELSMCSMYMNIFALRYAGHLDYVIQVDQQVMEYGIPKNLLQPIIENFFVHGIRLEHESNRFVIRGYVEEGDVCFIFEDNGRGMNRDRLNEIRKRLEGKDPKGDDHYGLTNVQERIRLVFGDAYGVEVESEAGKQTRVLLRIKALSIPQLQLNLHLTG